MNAESKFGNTNRKGKLFIISGPSGSGKTTIAQEVCKTNNIWFSISATTRPRREDEIEGSDYLFYSEEAFANGIRDGEFLEHAVVHGKRYGTPRKPVIERLQSGEDVILDIDVQGAMQVVDIEADVVMVFVITQDRSELEARLRGRGTESEESILERMKTSDWEVTFSDRYDYLLVNDCLEVAIEDFKAIIRAESLKIPNGGKEDRWQDLKQKT